MYTHINELYGSLPTEKNNFTSSHKVVDDKDLDVQLTVEELKQAVFSQQNAKSPGRGNLIAELLENNLDIISPFLLGLYNKIS